MLTQDYAVRLDSFEGPLDLLLHLITRAEVDVSELSLAAITEQYLSHLSRVSYIDMEPAGEFLVTAATLIELKSRVLVPPSEEELAAEATAIAPKDADNPAVVLVKQLLEYKRFRESAGRLEQRRALWDKRHPLGAILAPERPRPEGSTGDDGPPLDLEDLSLFDLVQSYARIAQTVVFDRLGDHSVVDSDTPIELFAADILDRLRAAPNLAHEPGIDRAPTLPLRTIFYGRRRGEMIGLFLALLELMRQRAVRIVQRREEPEPIITLSEPDATEPGTPPENKQESPE